MKKEDQFRNYGINGENMKTDFKKIGYEVVNWIYLARNIIHWQTFVSIIMIFRLTEKASDLFEGLKNIITTRNTILLGWFLKQSTRLHCKEQLRLWILVDLVSHSLRSCIWATSKSFVFTLKIQITIIYVTAWAKERLIRTPSRCMCISFTAILLKNK